MAYVYDRVNNEPLFYAAVQQILRFHQSVDRSVDAQATDLAGDLRFLLFLLFIYIHIMYAHAQCTLPDVYVYIKT
jgi:hypothetical protein